jgi:hypothetical protein
MRNDYKAPMNDRKRAYVTPQCRQKGGIAELTQQDKVFGAGDGFFLVINGTSNAIKNLS